MADSHTTQKVEHEELHAELAKAATVAGKIGEAARQAVQYFQPLDSVDFPHDAVQDCGRIPRTGADL